MIELRMGEYEKRREEIRYKWEKEYLCTRRKNY